MIAKKSSQFFCSAHKITRFLPMFLNKFLQAILWRHYAICSQPNFDDPKNRATQKWLGYAKTVLINRRFWGRWKWWEEVIFRPYVGDEVTPFNLAFFAGQNAITPPPMPSIRQRPKRAVRPSAPVKPFRPCLPSVNRQPPRPNAAPILRQVKKLDSRLYYCTIAINTVEHSVK